MHRVVIVGAGFGGLEAAKQLSSAPVEVTVVDRRNHHLFQPLLYQVATAGLNPADIAHPIRSILRRQRNAHVVLGEIVDIDTDADSIVLGDGSGLGYDHLVLAAGARHAYFGHEDCEQHAPGLKSIEDAIEIRRRVLGAFEAAEQSARQLADLGVTVALDTRVTGIDDRGVDVARPDGPARIDARTVLGRSAAVAEFGRIRFSGFVAWVLWWAVHIALLIGFRSRALVMFGWGWSWLTFRRGARLITSRWQPAP